MIFVRNRLLNFKRKFYREKKIIVIIILLQGQYDGNIFISYSFFCASISCRYEWMPSNAFNWSTRWFMRRIWLRCSLKIGSQSKWCNCTIQWFIQLYCTLTKCAYHLSDMLDTRIRHSPLKCAYHFQLIIGEKKKKIAHNSHFLYIK